MAGLAELKQFVNAQIPLGANAASLDVLQYEKALIGNLTAADLQWAFVNLDRVGKTGSALNNIGRLNNTDLAACHTLADVIAAPYALNAVLACEGTRERLYDSGYLKEIFDTVSDEILTALGVAIADDVNGLSAIIASSVAMAAIAASSVAMAAIAASSVAMAAIVASSVAMAAIVASSVAMAAIVASSVAMAAIVASSVAMSAIAASSVAMAAIVASSVAMAAIIASSVAMSAIAASSVAMAAIVASSVAMAAIVKSGNTAAFNASPYLADNFTKLRNTLADTAYFIRYPVASATTYNQNAYYYHNLTANTWTPGTGYTANQNAIYLIKNTRLVGEASYPVNVRAISKTGAITTLANSLIDPSTISRNLTAIGTLSIYNPYLTPAWTASADSVPGEAFIAL